MPSAPLRLRCEFVSNPLGISAARPRLSWWVADARPAEMQSAYEIVAASDLERLEAGEADLWLSGRVESDQCSHVEYGGAPLGSGERVWWQVRTFDSDGLSSPWSEPAFFEMGLLDEADWQGRWIATPLTGSRSRGVHVAALRREFELTAPVKSARLYVAALGDYRVEINGQPLPDADMNAVWSDYDHEIYYQTFDVTRHLMAEPNAIGVLLGDGFYAGNLPGTGRGNYGDRPQILLRLHVECDDGQALTLVSDHSWHWHPSWVLEAEINGGEHVDGRQYIDGWSMAGLDERGWAPVDVLPAPAGVLRAQPFPGMRVTQVLRPQGLPKVVHAQGRTTSVYDFGDQLLGRLRLEVTASASDEVVLTFAENASFEDAVTDTYTLSGEADGETIETQFALHAFRYLRVTVTSGVTTLRDAYALRTGLPYAQSVHFRCDHPTMNQLFEVLHKSLQGVALSVPMRGVVPTERAPDVRYASTWAPSFARMESSHALVSKWLADLKLNCQVLEEANPWVPAAARIGAHQAADEIARFELLAGMLWAAYRYHDDRTVLQQCYPELRVAALSCRHLSKGLIRAGVDEEIYGAGAGGDLVATCTLYGALRLAGRIAGVLTHLGDYELIESLAEDVRKAFRRRFLTVDGHLVGDTQSVYVAALHHNMLESGERVLAQQRLAELLQQANYHADVCPAVIHALLPTLTQAGRLDLAYMVLLQTSAPSWFASINGGTQLISRSGQRLDIADVGLMEWWLESLIGLSLDEDYSVDRNGYRSVRVQPMPPLGKLFLAGSPVQFVEASIETPHGVYEVNWYIREDRFELELRIPPNCNASVTMPDDIEQRVQSGRHRFVMDFDAGGDGIPTLLDMAGG